ncbi:CRISPR-associated helicase/endonuclease Cas3 [Thiohalocapsa halophila]|uniref:CRISPR-associated helicase/endonuclease Cas3 n=1 Tax=Thiohalocapsa halophila TaxID=69359 RepID=A0ABS1CM86_9GAMM|nr:CRISPR-associated helicase Cas3' [Thiohalocapsa halophila]MBK1632954.1 CRISPR-associated helicase/endonuclease Cas3 [Thiohalocapsa halophila]
MEIPEAGAFGKLERSADGRLTRWHPLVAHLIDVSACFLRLCRCRGIRRALEHAAGRALTNRDTARLAVLVFLHDLGKANCGFQAKRFLRGEAPRHWPMPCGHGPEAIDLLTDLDLVAHRALLAHLPLAAMIGWGDAVEALLFASFSHHGWPLGDRSQQNVAVWRAVKDANGCVIYDPDPILAEIARSLANFLPEAFAQGGPDLPDAPRFVHTFAGLVQFADWLGSDTRFFAFAEPGEDRTRTAYRCADDAVLALGLDAEANTLRARTTHAGLAAIIGEGNTPYPIQTALADPALASLVILESETGSGKTEAALWRYVQLFQAGEVDSLYFALPTRVAATQLCKRVERVAKRLWPNDTPVVVRALPGYVSAEGQEPQSLPHFRVLWPDDPSDAQAHRRWAAEAPKRFLAAPIAVGTIDQALLGGLQVRHAHMRHALLSRALLVVDEVHASDAYMQTLLEGLLDGHLACGGHVLLLSATLGARARASYLCIGSSAPVSTPSFDDACGAPYPAVSDVHRHRPVAATGRTKQVAWEAIDMIDDAATVARLALDAAAGDCKVLVIRNLVRTAIETQEALEAQCGEPAWLFDLNGAPTLHHSRFSRQDRPALDDRVEALLGKKSPAGPRVLVGTQTLEQSLDIDADLLITDLCPMDVLLQRIGRLHRHDRPDRPSAHRTARVIVLIPKDGDLAPLLSRMQHGLGPIKDGDGIYPDLRIIACTLEQICSRPQIAIPADNRSLVEAATHPERLGAFDKLGDSWQAHARGMIGNAGAKRAHGHLQRLHFDQSFRNQQFDPNVESSTRLGLRDRLVLFEPAPAGPFGAPLRALAIPSWLTDKDLNPDAAPEVICADAQSVQFRLGTRCYRYDRFGLRVIDPD